ncbi:MAG: hypothetical protein WC455_12575 [Dehalococcoidia bacterium]|jgi:hypothetical protein
MGNLLIVIISYYDGMGRILLGHRITVEPIYKTLSSNGSDSIAITPAMPKLEGTISTLEDGINALAKYFSAIPGDKHDKDQ